MSNINDKLIQLAETKSNIRDAIISKGVEVDTSLPFGEYANKIKEISKGGASSSVSVEPVKMLNAEKTDKVILDKITYEITGLNSSTTSVNQYLRATSQNGLDITGSYDFFFKYDSSQSSTTYYYLFDLINVLSDGTLDKGITVHHAASSGTIRFIFNTNYSSVETVTMSNAKLTKGDYAKITVDTSSNTITLSKLTEDGVYVSLQSYTPTKTTLPEKLNLLSFGTPADDVKATTSTKLWADDVKIEQNGRVVYSLLTY